MWCVVVGGGHEAAPINRAEVSLRMPCTWLESPWSQPSHDHPVDSPSRWIPREYRRPFTKPILLGEFEMNFQFDHPACEIIVRQCSLKSSVSFLHDACSRATTNSSLTQDRVLFCNTHGLVQANARSAGTAALRTELTAMLSDKVRTKGDTTWSIPSIRCAELGLFLPRRSSVSPVGRFSSVFRSLSCLSHSTPSLVFLPGVHV